MKDPLAPTPPDNYLGLNLRYWLKKWLPDPPADAIDQLVLAQLADMSSSLIDAGLRTQVQAPIHQFMHQREMHSPRTSGDTPSHRTSFSSPSSPHPTARPSPAPS